MTPEESAWAQFIEELGRQGQMAVGRAAEVALTGLRKRRESRVFGPQHRKRPPTITELETILAGEAPASAKMDAESDAALAERWCGATIPRRDPKMPAKVLGHLGTCPDHPLRAAEAAFKIKEARVNALENVLRRVLGRLSKEALDTTDDPTRDSIRGVMQFVREALRAPEARTEREG